MHCGFWCTVTPGVATCFYLKPSFAPLHASKLHLDRVSVPVTHSPLFAVSLARALQFRCSIEPCAIRFPYGSPRFFPRRKPPCFFFPWRRVLVRCSATDWVAAAPNLYLPFDPIVWVFTTFPIGPRRTVGCLQADSSSAVAVCRMFLKAVRKLQQDMVWGPSPEIVRHVSVFS